MAGEHRGRGIDLTDITIIMPLSALIGAMATPFAIATLTWTERGVMALMGQNVDGVGPIGELMLNNFLGIEIGAAAVAALLAWCIRPVSDR